MWRACNLTWFSPFLTGPVDYLFASRHKGLRFKSPGGVLMWNRDSPVSVVSLHWWPPRDWSSTGLRSQQLSLGPRADNVTVPLDLTQLSCPSFLLAAGLPSGFTTDGVGCWGGGEPCGEPAISHDSHHVSLVQWTTCLLPATRDSGSNPLGGYLCETGILLLALSRYRHFNFYSYTCQVPNLKTLYKLWFHSGEGVAEWATKWVHARSPSHTNPMHLLPGYRCRTHFSGICSWVCRIFLSIYIYGKCHSSRYLFLFHYQSEYKL